MVSLPNDTPMVFLLLAGAVFAVVTVGGLFLLGWARNADSKAVKWFAAIPLGLGAVVMGLILVMLWAPHWIFTSSTTGKAPQPAGEATNRVLRR